MSRLMFRIDADAVQPMADDVEMCVHGGHREGGVDATPVGGRRADAREGEYANAHIGDGDGGDGTDIGFDMAWAADPTAAGLAAHRQRDR
jgi:hypothetical protein